jgi:hypothetical protein
MTLHCSVVNDGSGQTPALVLIGNIHALPPHPVRQHFKSSLQFESLLHRNVQIPGNVGDGHVPVFLPEIKL